MGAVLSKLQVSSPIINIIKLWMKSRIFRIGIVMITLLFGRGIYNKCHRMYYHLPLNGPLGLPLVGCKLYLLLNGHKFMARMSKYGDIATYNDGFKTILLINDCEIAKKLLKQTKELSNKCITKCIKKYINTTMNLRKDLKLIIFDIMMMTYFGMTLNGMHDGSSINDRFDNKWNEFKNKLIINNNNNNDNDDQIMIMRNMMDIISASLEWSIMSLCGKYHVLQNKIYREIYESCNGNINSIDLENINYLQNIPTLKGFIYDNLNFSELKLKQKGLVPHFRRNSSTKPIKIELSNGKIYDVAPNGLYQLNMDGMHKRFILIILSLLIYIYSFEFKGDTKYDIIINKREEITKYKMEENHNDNTYNEYFEYNEMEETMEKQKGSLYINQTQKGSVPDIIDMEEEEKQIEPLHFAEKININNINISHYKQEFHQQFNEFFIFFCCISILFIPILFCLILLNDDDLKKEDINYKKVEKAEDDKKEYIKHEFDNEFNTFFVFCLGFLILFVLIWRSFLFFFYYIILFISWHILLILQIISFNHLFFDFVLILFIPILFYLILLNDDDLKKEENDKKKSIKQQFHVQFNEFFIFLPCILISFLFIFIYVIPILFCFLSFYILIIAVKTNINFDFGWNVFKEKKEKKEKKDDKKECIKPKCNAQFNGFFVFCLFILILFMLILHSFLFFVSYFLYYAIFFVLWHIFIVFQIFFSFKYSFFQFFSHFLTVFGHFFVFGFCIFWGFFSQNIVIYHP